MNYKLAAARNIERKLNLKLKNEVGQSKSTKWENNWKIENTLSSPTAGHCGASAQKAWVEAYVDG